MKWNSVGVRGGQVPHFDWQPVAGLVLHAGDDGPAVDRVGHQRLATLQFGHLPTHAQRSGRLLDPTWKRQVINNTVIHQSGAIIKEFINHKFLG